MSKTIVESRAAVMMQGFRAALKLFHEGLQVTELDDGALLIEDEQPIRDMTFVLTRNGIEFKHEGVIL